MKPTRLPHLPHLLRLLAGAACASLAALTHAESPPPPPAPPAPAATDLSSSSTSVSTSVTDGKGTITIIVEKDGKKETRTLNLNSDDPAKLAETLVEELRDRHETTPASPKKKVTYLGVMFAEAGEGGSGAAGGGGAQAPGLPAGTGLAISGVSAESPAEKAGLKAGDLLGKLDDQILVNPAQFTTLIRNKKEGDTITLHVIRGGEAKDFEVTLATRDEEQPPGFGFGSGGAGNAERFLLKHTRSFPEGLREGRILRLEKDGRVIEERISGDPTASLAPPPPGVPAPPPAPRSPASPDPLANPHDAIPSWEKALRDAADIKEKAAEQWKKQLTEWRAQWTKTQEQTADDYRRALEKLGEEIRKANEAARKAQEEARRALDAWMEKRSEEKPAPPTDGKKDPAPEPPKKA